jgi:glycosyltransferase involved in cell wall biosynthesis
MSPKNPFKILHILDHSLPLHSGYTFRSQNIFRSQRKMGFHPVILTSPKHEASWKGECRDKETINEFLYYRTGAVKASRIPIQGEFRLMNVLEKRLHEVALIEKPDILHAHSPVLNALPALKVGRKLGIPVVYEIRAFWEDAAVDHGTYAENSIKYRMTRAVET